MEMVGVDKFSMLKSRPNQKEYIKLLDAIMPDGATYLNGNVVGILYENSGIVRTAEGIVRYDGLMRLINLNTKEMRVKYLVAGEFDATGPICFGSQYFARLLGFVVNLSSYLDARIPRADDFVVLNIDVPSRYCYKNTIRLTLEDGILVTSCVDIHEERNATL